MKKMNFLSKLSKEGKIKLVEPSEVMQKAYFNKSESNLFCAKLLFENNRFEESISMAYYSMYNCLNSLLFKIGIKCENHSGAILLLKVLFEIDNSEISFVKSERIDKQYYVDFKITKEQILEIIRIAEKTNRELSNFIALLNNKSIGEYRKKFLKIVK